MESKVAIVTGGASGIGRALCEQLARAGTIVVVADINVPGAQQVASGIERTGGRAEPCEVNVSSASEVESLVQATVSKHGRLDYMFNNAAIAVVGEIRDSVLDDWRKVLDVNLMGVIYGSLSAYKVMLQQGSGHIVNIASITGLLPGPVLAPYSTSKWGAIGFTLALRAEAAELGVRVTAACPSLVNTNIPDRTTYLKISKEAYLKRLPWRGAG